MIVVLPRQPRVPSIRMLRTRGHRFLIRSARTIGFRKFIRGRARQHLRTPHTTLRHLHVTHPRVEIVRLHVNDGHAARLHETRLVHLRSAIVALYHRLTSLLAKFPASLAKKILVLIVTRNPRQNATRVLGKRDRILFLEKKKDTRRIKRTKHFYFSSLLTNKIASKKTSIPFSKRSDPHR